MRYKYLGFMQVELQVSKSVITSSIIDVFWQERVTGGVIMFKFKTHVMRSRLYSLRLTPQLVGNRKWE